MSASSLSGVAPLIVRAGANEDRRPIASIARGQFRWNVPAERDDAVRAVRTKQRRSIRHCRALGETEKDQGLWGLGSRGGLEAVDHAIDVRHVVGDRELAIFAGHPTGHGLLPVASVEAMQCLHRGDPPAGHAWESAGPPTGCRRRSARSRERPRADAGSTDRRTPRRARGRA